MLPTAAQRPLLRPRRARGGAFAIGKPLVLHPPSQRLCRAARGPAGPGPAQIPDLEERLQEQIDQILREIDPEGLVDDAEEIALLEAEEEAAAAAAGGPSSSSSAAADRVAAGAAATTAATTRSGSGAAPSAAAAGGGRRGRRKPLGPEPPSQPQGTPRGEEEEEEEDENALVEIEGLPPGVKLTVAEHRRKGAVLLEMMRAGPNGLDEKLAAFKHEIDEVLVVLMQKRLDTARLADADPDVVGGMEALLGSLRREQQRAAASPAMRLLDDVLAALAEGDGSAEARRRAAAMMRDAFTGGALPVDVFTAAAALAEGGLLAAEALQIESVSPVAFLAEATELLEESKQQHKELVASVTAFQAELAWAERNCPDVLKQPDVQARLIQFRAAEAAVAPRERALQLLQEAVLLAEDYLTRGAAAVGLAGPPGGGPGTRG